MVHRIQNRNTGYSDFTTNNSSAAFSFSNTGSNPITHGANALKLENEVVNENSEETIDQVNNEYHEELLKNQEAESIVENTSLENEVSFSQEAMDTLNTDTEQTNDLKEFGVNTDEPDLFSSDNQDTSSEDLLGSSNEENDEDDLEIPAFLRRQKN